MRRKVRGLRDIERRILAERTEQEMTAATDVQPAAKMVEVSVAGQDAADARPPVKTAKDSTAGQVVLDYCADVRGILNDDQGGPLHPPGVRMAEALAEVQASIGRAQVDEKGGSTTARSPTLQTVSNEAPRW